jgi:hypothetical protein
MAILITLVWRTEVELRGWDGLKWISYYHWAIPIGVLLFATWLTFFSNLPTLHKRLQLAGLFLLAFIPLYEILRISLSLFFVTGPSAFMVTSQIGLELFSILRLSIYLIYPGILGLFWLVAQKFGLILNQRIYLASASFYLGAWLLAMAMSVLTGVPTDAIHTIKSGNLFLFMTIGLGIPFLAPYQPKN